MPTSSVGITSSTGFSPCNRRGVTLLELVVVVALASILVGLSFPAVSSGIDSLRLRSASDSVVSFLNGALTRAERHQQIVEVSILKRARALTLRSTEPGFYRRLDLPEGVEIVGVLPAVPVDPDAPRHFLLYPGGTVPAVGIQLVNRRGRQRIVRVDPMTGAPRVEDVQ